MCLRNCTLIHAPGFIYAIFHKTDTSPSLPSSPHLSLSTMQNQWFHQGGFSFTHELNENQKKKKTPQKTKHNLHAHEAHVQLSKQCHSWVWKVLGPTVDEQNSDELEACARGPSSSRDTRHRGRDAGQPAGSKLVLNTRVEGKHYSQIHTFYTILNTHV